MRRTTFSIAAISLAALLGGCSDDPVEIAKLVPAGVDTVAGRAEKQVTLTKDAAERIAVATGAVSSGSGTGKTVPYGAVIYDADGLAWAYVLKAENVFIREPLDIDRIEGDRAYLKAGPAVGTKVAVVGVAELYGAETGIGK
jgi:hypothetical protein